MGNEIEVFVSLGEDEVNGRAPEDLLGPYGLRARLVRLNPFFLKTFETTAQAPAREQTLRFNLFPSSKAVALGGLSPMPPVDVLAIIEKTEGMAGAFAMSGTLEDDPDSWLTLVQVGETLDLSLNSVKHGLFEAVIELPDSGLHVIRQLDPEKLPQECGTDILAIKGEEGGADEVASSATTSIDVLVVYTPATRARLKTDEAVLALAVSAVARGNDAFTNSRLPVTLNLKRCEPLVGYDEPSTDRPYYTMLDQLVDGTAPGLGQLHELRTTEKADVVVMLAADQSLGGLANVMQRPTPRFTRLAYSVVNYAVSARTWTLVHEIAHNIGCCHEAACVASRPYGRGHSFIVGGVTYKTLMVRKSEPGQRIPYFSNPAVQYKGVSTGMSDRDNARVISENAPTISALL